MGEPEVSGATGHSVQFDYPEIALERIVAVE